jgi:hypothetical protein
MMKTLSLVLTALLLSFAGGAQPPATQKAQRIPLQKKPIIFKSPTEYAQRFLGNDPKTGQGKYYDPKPQVKPVNEKSGLYALNWIGYDGRVKTIIYQRPDAIDATVSADVSKIPSGKYLYVYSIKNLPSSGEYLKIFALQTFTSDAKPHKSGNFYIGAMSLNNVMQEGNWIGFGIISNIELIANPGKTVEFKLESHNPPGVVECRVAGGNQGMKGVGEEMPTELENLLPRYEAWPSGYTIGPIDKLRAISRQEKIDYLLKVISTFKQQGWITSQVSLSYEQLLRRNDLQGITKRSANDLRAASITSEVVAIIEAMAN